MTTGGFDTIPRGSPSSSPNVFLSRPISPSTPTLLSVSKEKSTPYDKLDLRQSNSESLIEGVSPLRGIDTTDGGVPLPSSPFTKKEMKQLKKFDKEPLVNKSPTVHIRRKAEYIDIDLPDTASEGSSESASFYDIPKTARQSLYDVPPPAKPMNLDPAMKPMMNQDPAFMTYDVPSSITVQTETTNSTSTNTRPSSSSPTHRALPHLPTDYENVKLPKKLSSSGGYVNVGYHPVKPTLETGLYMEVPFPEKPQSRSMSNIYCDIPERMESQLTIRRVESDQPSTSEQGLKLAKALEEDGYEFINPATQPALKSPPVAPTVTEEGSDLEEDDVYIEVHRPSQSARKWAEGGNESNENIDFCQVRSRSKRLSDGYEEITDVVRELREKSPPVPLLTKPDGTISESEQKRKGTTPPLEQTERRNQVVDEDQSLSRHLSSESDRSMDNPLEPARTRPNQLSDDAIVEPSSKHQLETQKSFESKKLVVNGDVKEYCCDPFCDEEDDEEEDFEEVSIDSSVSKERSSSDPSSPPRTHAVTISRDSKYIATALGSPDADRAMLLRKRSSTLGDILDTKEPKKHTYVNVPDKRTSQTPPLGSPKSPLGDMPKKKPPMPLPRPPSLKNMTIPRQTNMNTVIDPCVNGNHSNNKVKSLVRQFSDF